MSKSFNTDSHYEIGSSHKVCEDFAIHGFFQAPNGSLLHYGIVSDGCSSSMNHGGIRNPINVDIGARLLCLVAKQAIKEMLPTLKCLDGNFYDLIKSSILIRINILLKQINLPIPAIDCTLLINIVFEDEGFTAIFGDGVFVRCYNDYFTEIYIVEYKSGAPYYLSYLLDSDRQKLYKEKFGEGKKTIKKICINRKIKDFTIGDVTIGGDGITIYDDVCSAYDYPTYYTTDISIFQNLRTSIISDGALTYQKKIEDKSTKEPIQPEDIIPKLIDIKGLKGNFLGRVMNLVHRWEKKEKVDHYDDLSIASIIELPKKEEKNG